MGTTVARGRGRGMVIATGKETILGQIASLSNQTEGDLSPLQKEINNISLKLTIGTVIIGTVLFVISLLIDLSLYESFLFALGIAMSLVPQGMPAQISIALSLASSRLSHQNVVVKKLSSIETLGSTTIICTDKTGTLTQNQMTVEHIVLGTDVYNVSGVGYKPQGNIIDHT
jgi:Ca2+-transporting ATPase